MLSRRTFLLSAAATPVLLNRSSAVAANDKLTLGFIGRIDNYAKRRLGAEIETVMPGSDPAAA